MEKTKIDWCESTWNPITGCFHDCQYCYARRIAERFGGKALNTLHILNNPYVRGKRTQPYPFGFTPTFHKYRLNDYSEKKGRSIFVCSMADMFGKWVPDEWIKEIFEVCGRTPQHQYLFLTKNPDRYIELLLKDALPENKNMWYGMSVTRREDTLTAEAITQELPSGAGAFLSIEPILEDVVTESLEIVVANFTDWVIIGAETGNRKGKITPERSWIEDIVKLCAKYDRPVFMKESLREIWQEPLIQEYPEGMR